MPAPAKTGIEAITAAGAGLLEEGGPEAVTMQAVAERVGVRAPSLYKHVRDRRALLAEVTAATVRDLTDRLEAADDDDPERSVLQQLRAVRRFALERPHGFGLVFGAAPGVPRPAAESLADGLRPLMAAMAALVGPERALDGARFVTAWANGFLTMELTGALRMGGDVAGAWEWGLARVVAALR